MTRGFPESGDILLTTEAPLGEVATIKDKNIALAQRVILLRSDPKLLINPFLEYWLKSNIGQSRINSRSSGSTVTGIRSSELKKVLISIPSVSQQEQIAGILSAFDRKIEINNKIAKTLEEIAQTLFKEWFVGGASPDWKTSKFENYARLEYGKALQEGKRIPGKVLVFGSSGQVGTHNEKLCSGPGVVIGRKGNVGSVFWIDDDFYPIDTTFFVKPKISLYYIYFVLKNMRFHTGDSAVPGLNRESVHTSEILVPDENILNKFEEIVTPMFKRLAEIKKENQKLAALRDLLLPKLMKGEIRI